MSEQMFEDYKSKYLDMYEKIKSEKNQGSEKVSILEDVDFELELIHKDEINVAYILKLLAKYKDSSEEEKTNQRENISNILSNNPQLRSKKELIEKFINENLYAINEDDIEEEFDKFWEEEKDKAYKELCSDENLDCKEVRKVVDKYIYEQRVPLKDEIVKTLKVKPKLLERQKVIPRVLDKIVRFVEKFYDDLGTQSGTAINSAEYSNENDNLLVAQPKPQYN
jgi:type I restriction enzyme R subunit